MGRTICSAHLAGIAMGLPPPPPPPPPPPGAACAAFALSSSCFVSSSKSRTLFAFCALCFLRRLCCSSFTSASIFSW